MNSVNNEYDFECVKCGKCCEAGLEILIEKEEILKWQKLKKESFLKHIYLDPKSISLDGLAGYHIGEKNALLELQKKHEGAEYEEKERELKVFVQNNHIFMGRCVIPLPVYTFIEELGRMPLLIPKSFESMLEGLTRGLVYLLLYESNGKCPFIKDYLCTIHSIKPKDCRMFPYDDKGNIKINNYFLKTCQGIKRKEKIKN